MNITRDAIERALYYCCAQEPATPPDYRLCKKGKRLSEVYGVMLWEKLVVFPRDRMNADQLAAFDSVPASIIDAAAAL